MLILVIMTKIIAISNNRNKSHENSKNRHIYISLSKKFIKNITVSLTSCRGHRLHLYTFNMRITTNAFILFVLFLLSYIIKLLPQFSPVKYCIVVQCVPLLL